MISFEGFRDGILGLAPRWLREEWGAKYLYTLGLMLDIATEAARQGVKARFPKLAPDDALPLIAHDRGIVLGFDEPRKGSEARLRTAVTDSKVAGGYRALLRQVRGYYATHAIRCGVVTNRGTWHTWDENDVYTVTKLAGNWDWDGSPGGKPWWGRWWLIIWPLDVNLIDDEGEFNDSLDDVFGDGGTIGTTASPSMVATIREIVREWWPQGTSCSEIIIALDPESFDYSAPPGAPLPDGTWREWAVDDGTGVLRPMRLDTARYWDGTRHASIETGT